MCPVPQKIPLQYPFSMCCHSGTVLMVGGEFCEKRGGVSEGKGQL